MRARRLRRLHGRAGRRTGARLHRLCRGLRRRRGAHGRRAGGGPGRHRLRGRLTAEHALQCGYCTPGMLVTARDIVQLLPDASDDQIRLSWRAICAAAPGITASSAPSAGFWTSG
ncbi:MAG: 2Fe-2S iron-sulfur cluster-binding protein [Acetobacteraceae bacterium]